MKEGLKEVAVPGLVRVKNETRAEVIHVGLVTTDLGTSLSLMTDHLDAIITVPYEGVEGLFHESV